MGKSYACRKREELRPEGDFYPTPSCMVRKILDEGLFMPHRDKSSLSILDPCCGRYAIGNVLREYGYDRITETDLMYGYDFLSDEPSALRHWDVVVMNPPFKLFDQFVRKALSFADTVWCIGKLNFFGAHSRNVDGLWKDLAWVYPFDRMIAFDKPETDGLVECGMMVTGWFVWEKGHAEGFPRVRVLDMQKYIRSRK